MHNRSICLLILTILFCSMPVLAADPYAAQKAAYITAHPGQSLIPYSWNTSTTSQVLPFDYSIPAAPGNNISLSACRNEFEPASLIITAQKNITAIGVSVSDLKNNLGNTIPSAAVDVRLVKVWYQANANDIFYNTPNKFLTPELLLKDDSLVKVDYVNKVNYLKVTISGSSQYVDISTPTAVFPTAATVNDAASLQPFSLITNESKQIWLTVHVPDNAPAGDYNGSITITSASEIPVILNLKVTVLPFDLEPSPVEYSLYYRGRIPVTPQAGINSEYKTAAQYSLELKDMKDHGVLYPALTQGNDNMLETALSLRNQSGLPMDHIYAVSMETGNSTDPAVLAAMVTKLNQYKSATSKYGFSKLYVYGVDEAKGSVIQSERTALQTAKQNGAYVFTAGGNDVVDYIGDILDVAIIAGAPNTSQVTRWHNYGKKIFLYAYPPCGVENSEMNRKNYGFILWNAGYDGEMDYSYQHSYGNIWNDYDVYHIRDHVFAYPTSNGVIDTIEWEGFREGVDDTRYLASLKKIEGNDVSGRTIVSGSLTSGNDMATIRKKVVAQILSHSSTETGVSTPVAGFTGTPVTGTSPLKVQFTDTSTNNPTSWTWTFGDGSSVNATVQNPIHTYSAAGTYTVALTAENAAGSTTKTQTGYITVGAAPVIPVAGFTGTPVTGTSPLKVQFTDTSTNSPTSWTWTFGDGSSVNATVQNPIHTYSAAGTYTVTLTAKNAAGSGTKTQTNYVTVTTAPVIPVAGFTGTPVTGTSPLKVQFTDTSTNTPTSWTWTFGDGSSVNATVKNPLHTYSAAGTYTVTLTAKNAAGSGSTTKTNYITVVASTNPPPTAQFTANITSGTVPMVVQFTITSITARSDITSGVWDVNNDGKIEFAIRNPVYVYQTPGTYTVNLTLTNADGTGSIIKTNYITVSPRTG
jgi:PKD repeat protein